MRIAVDAMGGDRAPEEIIAGALMAKADRPDEKIVLVGDQAAIQATIAQRDGAAGEGLEIVHCTEAIGMDESPVEALRHKTDSSIRRGWELMARGSVEAFISAGNTGAMVAGGALGRRYLKGVERPGIAVVIPTLKGPCVTIDVGASVSCKPIHLYQFGVMAKVYAQNILRIEDPRVGILSVGEEQSKGNPLVFQAREMMVQGPFNFIGHVEGGDLLQGVADVVVCEGFVGNVILKVCEGMGEMFQTRLGQRLASLEGMNKQQSEKLAKQMWSDFDYAEYGGAPLMGIDGVCIICHGRSDARAIKNAIRVASESVRFNLNQRIVDVLAPATPTLAQSN